MITIEFDKGLFSLNNSNHVVTVTLDGTITSYTGRSVTRMPKGFKKVDIKDAINNINSDYVKTLAELTFNYHYTDAYELAKKIERLYNTGVLENLSTCEPYLWLNFSKIPFKRALKMFREYISEHEGQHFTPQHVLDWHETKKFMALPNIAILMQHYDEEFLQKMYNYHTKDWNIVSKMLQDDSIYDMYSLNKDNPNFCHNPVFSVQTIINTAIDLSEKLQVKIPRKDILHNVARMQREWTKIKNQKCDSVIAKHNLTHFAYKNDKFIVIVPQTMQELIKEGNAQHNCVGDYWTYSYGNDIGKGKMSRGVVFIRHIDSPTKSYITCDFDLKTMRIKQYLATCNRSVFDENALKFKEEYQNYLYSLVA